LQPQPPPPAVPAHRLRTATWLNGRTALGAAFVLLAVLAGALFLDRAQRLVPVYAAARDLPAGEPLKHGDLMVVRVRLPDSALRHYLQPGPGRALPGRLLTAPIRREALVPAEFVLASSRQADLVELPVQVDSGDMAQGLRPGDRVQVLAAFTEGARRGRAVVLLPSAEVVQVLEDPAGLTGSGQERGVQLRMPSDRAPMVAAAIATARIFVVKAPGLATDPAATATPPNGIGETQPGANPTDEDPADGAPPSTGPVDTSPEGTGPPDAGPESTAPEDTGSPNQAPSDTGSPDASSLDASSPDASASQASPPGSGASAIPPDSGAPATSPGSGAPATSPRSPSPSSWPRSDATRPIASSAALSREAGR
jgi:hypothetical protein